MFAAELQGRGMSDYEGVITRSEVPKQSRLNFKRLPRADKSGLAMTGSEGLAMTTQISKQLCPLPGRESIKVRVKSPSL
jgi:hypothetical protein